MNFHIQNCVKNKIYLKYYIYKVQSATFDEKWFFTPLIMDTGQVVLKGFELNECVCNRNGLSLSVFFLYRLMTNSSL